jgi:LPPG:FO 2-phospho-L-lactate transferase
VTVAVLCGGVGGSRFLRALLTRLAPERITAIINTADDEEFHGLHVSPDPDIVTYALGGVVDEERGWGIRGDTFRWLESLRRFGQEMWFQIGDRDLATHLHRTRLLREGRTLSEVMGDIARAFGVGVRLLPMSDEPVRTLVETDGGPLRFQQYLVKHRAAPAVRGVRYEGADHARPAPGVLETLGAAEAIFIAPSNPVGSIAPILAVPGVRAAVASARARRVAVSPIIGGRPLQPPAGEMMAGLGYAVDVAGVARFYAGTADSLVIDESDAQRARAVQDAGMKAVVAPSVLRDDASRRALADAVLSAADVAP